MPRLMLKPVLKIGGIVAFVAVLALYFWWANRIPEPHEGDRVTHREGLYSIIKPRDWEVSFNYSPGDQTYLDTLEIRLPTTRARDLRFFVGRLREPPDLESIKSRQKLIATEFQGQPAWIFEGRTRLEHVWRALFQRGGQWYELNFWTLLPEDVPRSGWWHYLQSFRASERSATTRSRP